MIKWKLFSRGKYAKATIRVTVEMDPTLMYNALCAWADSDYDFSGPDQRPPNLSRTRIEAVVREILTYRGVGSFECGYDDDGHTDRDQLDEWAIQNIFTAYRELRDDAHLRSHLNDVKERLRGRGFNV